MSVVLFEHQLENRVLMVRLNRPKANILDKEMIQALHEGIGQRVTAQTCAILLTHAGPHFSFGASVEEHRGSQAADMLKSFHGLFHFLHELSLPVLAAVNGQCLGGGMELATFSHFIFAGEKSFFGQPEIKLAVFPPMASLILNLKCPGLADEMNLTGRSFAALELKSSGLLTRISETPEQDALAFAKEHFLEKSCSSLRLATRANRWRMEEALQQTLPRLEKLYLDELMATHDANEGIHAFLEKRKPEWRHQ